MNIHRPWPDFQEDLRLVGQDDGHRRSDTKFNSNRSRLTNALLNCPAADHPMSNLALVRSEYAAGKQRSSGSVHSSVIAPVQGKWLSAPVSALHPLMVFNPGAREWSG